MKVRIFLFYLKLINMVQDYFKYDPILGLTWYSFPKGYKKKPLGNRFKDKLNDIFKTKTNY